MYYYNISYNDLTTLDDNFSMIGDFSNYDQTAIICPSNTNNIVASVTLKANHVYILTGGIEITNISNGILYLGTNLLLKSYYESHSVHSGTNAIAFSTIYKVNSDDMIVNLYEKHTQSVDAKVYRALRAVCII